MPETAYHNLSWQEVVKKLGSDPEAGLSERKVKERQKKFGPNKLPEEKPFSQTKLFWAQLKSPLIYILLIAGVVTLLLKEYTDTIVIWGAVVLNTLVGFFQERKASQALNELRKVIRHRALVVRGGNPKVIKTQDLVPGDIILLGPGDRVPADARLLESQDLKTNEMALTGEWLPASKHEDPLPKDKPLADRDNMVYLGTLVEAGKGRAVVTTTGLATELGKIAQLVKETKEETTPLQKKLAYVGKLIGGLITVIAILIFITGIVKGNSFLEMFTTAIAVAVAAIPEGLPVALTVILALGMQRILKRKGLVRKLLAAETLGSTSVICTDKTATLTEGKMKVANILTGSQELLGQRGRTPKKIEKKETTSHLLALKIATLCSSAFIENPEAVMEKWIIRGQPTDKALLRAGVEAGLNKNELEKQMRLLAELPFSSHYKYIARLFKTGKRGGGERLLYVSGAPERVLEMAKSLELEGEPKKLTSPTRVKIEKKLEALTSKGLRVVAVGYKKIKKDPPGSRRQQKSKIKNTDQKYKSIAIEIEKEVKNLVFVGFIALKDPLRKEVKEAIKTCRQAGMRPILVTGDHKLTAKAVAQEIGLGVERENVLEGKELDQMSDRKLKEKIKKIKIYARVEPRHKMRIIEAWQTRGEVVAMTGDGINDAPALKKADIGVALGSGTDVAKEVSDLILLTDSFNIIVSAIEEGRVIIDNIRKVIAYLLAGSFTEIILIGVSLLLGRPLPVTAAQILWVNLIEDGPLGISLAFQPKEKDLMRQKPIGHHASLFTQEIKALVFIIGLVSNLFLLGLFFWLLKYSGYDILHIRSIVFVGLTIDSIFYVFSCKSLRRNLWDINLLSNRFLLWFWLFGVIALLAALYLPPFQTLLKTVPLTLFDWTLLLILGLVNIVLIEATKWFFIARKQFT